MEDEVKSLPVKLHVQDWQYIMNALAQRPYVEVARMLAAIDTQLTPPTSPA